MNLTGVGSLRDRGVGEAQVLPLHVCDEGPSTVKLSADEYLLADLMARGYGLLIRTELNSHCPLCSQAQPQRTLC